MLLSDNVMRALRGLASVLPQKDSLRSYGKVIGIRNGFAYVTNGYAVLRYRDDAFIGKTLTLSPDLGESSVAFPDCEGPMRPDETAEIICNPGDIIKLCRPWPTKGHDNPHNPSAYLRIDGERNVSLMAAPNRQLGDRHFSAPLISHYLRGVHGLTPETAEITSVVCEDMLHLMLGKFQLTVCSIKEKEA